MSFLAKLVIDGAAYNVMDCAYSFNQSVDNTNKPSAKTSGGRITLTLESTESTDLIHWMVSNTQTKDGTITFFKRDAMSRMREISFKKAFCIHFTEFFNAYGSTPMQSKLVISPEVLVVGDVNFENKWGNNE